MKKCQNCGNQNSDEMRFCLECGTPLPDAPIVVNLQDSEAQSQPDAKTVSYGRSMETQIGGRNAAPRNFANIPPSKPKGSGKIFLVIGGFALIFLMFLTAGTAIVIYNWDEIARLFEKPTPTPTRTPTPTPTLTPTPTRTPTPKPTPTPTPTPTSSKASFDKIWVDYNVTENGRLGMRIHIKFSVYKMKDQKIYLAVYFQKKDGTSLTSSDPDYSSANGNLAVFSALKPGYDSTDYNDLQVFMPYGAFDLKRGKNDLKMDVDLIYENGDLIEHLTYNDFWIEQK